MSPALFELQQNVPECLQQIFIEITALTDEFCLECLNEEYRDVCRIMAMDLCQEGTPVKRGKRASWACGIAHAVGMINFLSDSSYEPCMKPGDIAKWFGVSTGTMQAKSKTLRDGLDAMQFEPAYTIPSMIEHNPLFWLVELSNGMIVDARHMPREFQVLAYEQGAIPYVPDDEPEEEDDMFGKAMTG